MATPVYGNTLLGGMWVDPNAPFTINSAAITTVFQCRKSTDFPFTDTLSSDTIFKYYSIAEQVSTPYAHINFTVQSGSTGSDWTTVKEFARLFGKDTLQVSHGIVTGIEGTCTIPVSDHDYYRVRMNTYGTDSTTSFSIVAGLSNDHVFNSAL
jgi:hypothetical protein